MKKLSLLALFMVLFIGICMGSRMEASAYAYDKQIDLNTLNLSINDNTYTGSEIKPYGQHIITTVDSEQMIFIAGTDYDVIYENNIDVGEATVNLTGKGRLLTGSKTLKFKIVPINMTEYKKAFDFLEGNSYYFNGDYNNGECVYNGKLRTPKFVHFDEDNTFTAREPVQGKDYSFKYLTGCKLVGMHSLKVNFTGNYSGSLTYNFTIIPKPTKIKSIKTMKKAMVIKWKKQTAQVDGYQIYYDMKGKKGKYLTIKGNKTTSKKIKGLKSKKYYAANIRTYKKVGGKKYYSDWAVEFPPYKKVK